ncbi:cytochrome P450 [Actinomadura sp. NBRC 104425]|uniref:cytochrome P450 n=1 Tax=Actinomadura sp. NBRC 104425 TaxID=3032204 RepID=UPI0024A45651|nr:cytochrome P450 [Actinomadura sp. NBRC 104425]GLZ16317.1 cytochrome P450 [Actinomadura sp. NBRC 104425]
MTSPTADTTVLDLVDPTTFVRNDPHAYWAEIRDRHPVYWHPGGENRPGFWVVSRYADVVAAYADVARLSSARGTVLDVLLRGDDSAGGRMLAVTDRPRHRDLRNVMMRAFSPRVLGGVVEQVHRRAEELIRRVTTVGSFDFAAEVAEHIPMGTICDLLSIPQADRPDLLRWNKSALSSDDAEVDPFAALEARNEILRYLTDLAAHRRARPGDDVVSMIATATVGGRPLPIEDVALNCYSLILGGDESSRVSAICAVKAFADFPDQWRAVRDRDVSIDTAVEEVLRWATPAMHFARTATVDLELGGRQVRAGDIVTLWNLSANFDERQFHRPREFTVARDPNRHVSFGYGPHFCLGAYLGRAELRALLTALVTTVSDIELAGTPQRIYSNFLNGYSTLPVVFSGR